MGFVVVEEVFQKIEILKRFLKGFYHVFYPVRMSLVSIVDYCNSLDQLFTLLGTYRSDTSLLVKHHFFVFLTNMSCEKDQFVEEILLFRFEHMNQQEMLKQL